MNNFTFTGDWHAGVVSWNVPRTDEIEKALETVFKNVEEKKSDLIITGDIFEQFRYPGDEVNNFVSGVLKKFLDMEHSPVVIIIKGNHDWSGASAWGRFSNDRLVFVTEPKVVQLKKMNFLLLPHMARHRLPMGGISETAIKTWKNFIEKEQPKKEKNEEPETKKRGRRKKEDKTEGIMVGHWGIEGTVPAMDSNVMETLSSSCIEELASLGIKTIYMGHIHKHEKIYGFPCETYYTGSLSRNAFGEEKSCLGVWNMTDKYVVSDCPVPGIPLKTLEYDSETTCLEQLKQDLASIVEKTYVRVRAPLSPVVGEQIKTICEEWSDSVDSKIVTIDPRGVRSIDDEKLLKDAAVDEEMSLSVHSLWEEFVETKESGEVGNLVKEIGISLLNGSNVDELWEWIIKKAENVETIKKSSNSKKKTDSIDESETNTNDSVSNNNSENTVTEEDIFADR